MKVALYSHSIPPAVDGVSRRIASLLHELTKQGHEVRHKRLLPIAVQFSFVSIVLVLDTIQNSYIVLLLASSHV